MEAYPPFNNDKCWQPGRYDEDSWVKYSNLNGRLTKFKKAIPNDNS